ncbi:hypothetical protein CMUS01_04126 [Colletotrichum musicola]|uniref:Uncharacterized protein n=1 Tax=Colletotrichum musicola TaxID=2175873 RepID=A0A8H6NNX1_9PEZI|nr:hypothetical protein CMUS01_04126 [Colletotrichum musicola]
MSDLREGSPDNHQHSEAQGGLELVRRGVVPHLAPQDPESHEPHKTQPQRQRPGFLHHQHAAPMPASRDDPVTT